LLQQTAINKQYWVFVFKIFIYLFVRADLKSTTTTDFSIEILKMKNTDFLNSPHLKLKGGSPWASGIQALA
jgi:hypothetical protein